MVTDDRERLYRLKGGSMMYYPYLSKHVIVDMSICRPVGNFDGQTDVAYFKRYVYDDGTCAQYEHLINKAVLERHYEFVGVVEVEEVPLPTKKRHFVRGRRIPLRKFRYHLVERLVVDD